MARSTKRRSSWRTTSRFTPFRIKDKMKEHVGGKLRSFSVGDLHKMKLTADLKSIWKGPLLDEFAATDRKSVRYWCLAVDPARNQLPKAVRDPLLGSTVVRCLSALFLAGVAISPWVGRKRAAHDVERRLDAARASAACGIVKAPLDIALSLRQQRLGPLLASWEIIGGCGAGGTGGAGAGVNRWAQYDGWPV